MRLNCTRIGATSAPRTAWILHGILGSGRNWRSFARALTAEHPDWCILLPDHRNHGGTGSLPGPDRIADCVEDLEELPTPELVIGHSFGGKIALEYARSGDPCDQVWVLDSVPFASIGPADAEVMSVISAIEAVPMPAPNRGVVREHLLASGLPKMVADWLLSSVEREGDSWRWQYDLGGVRRMMDDYFKLDFGDFLTTHQGPPSIHLVRAERSDRWGPETLDRLAQASAATLHTLANAGHWLHVDNPRGLRAMLAPAFE